MMDFAFRVAQEARDRVKVGAVIADARGNILSYGYNGTPSGYSNEMRDEEGKTKECVLHAEQNAIIKMSSNGVSCFVDETTMYSTIAPCVSCSSAIVQSGIKTVIFQDYYKSVEGLEVLEACGVKILRIKREER